MAVVEKLRAAGFDAYLVGGCVRDLLIGRTPKDFDVATEATPEEVRAVLARVRIVGRRFRIAHVRMRGEIIEVSTFRGGHDRPGGFAATSTVDGVRDSASRSAAVRSQIAENGLILRDNAYGAIDEDVFRRDFTVNALYYDPAANVVLDYCGGMADIEARTLRLIGEPAQRLREDPVRILRALRFAAKLSLTLHPRTEEAIAPAAELLAAVAPARLFDEFAKMFLHGHGQRAFDLLRKYALLQVLFQLPPSGEAIARIAVANTDQRVAEGKPVTPGFLLAAFLWHQYRDHAQRLCSERKRRHGPLAEEREEAASAVLRAQQKTIAGPRRHGYFVRDVWALQPRFERRTPKNVAKLLAHRRFRAAYDFLLLRVQAGEAPAELGDWWTQAQIGDVEALVEEAQASAQQAVLANGHMPDAAPKRRRRRRRGKRLRAGVVQAVSSGGEAAAPSL